MRRKIIVGNWKMNHTIKESKEFMEVFDPFALECKRHDIDVGVAPSYMSLEAVASLAKNTIIFAQHVNHHLLGAYTGETSIPMLQEVGINACIIGHSERRANYAETSERCNKRLKVLFANHFFPIYCVGETLKEYEENRSKEVVGKQVKEGLANLDPTDIKNMVIAYEPVWSIGTGKSASSDIAEDMCAHIRNTVKELYGEEVASSIRIQYGGSVKTSNVKEYMDKENIDGVLVGGASLEANSFIELIRNVF